MIKKKIRCAIYTRKSCEEGLEQDFNSLDAQREACEAYIKSQLHEGWTLISKHYDDGGFSGGTMDRPAFKELLKDTEENKIDIIVVYKVDRLTRSIMDFAKIIDIFDKHSASFVSITQHFNTTTSMGRLTLNILLSFAQFEREVTGERIRDKFEASRQKGLWLTGAGPYGYKKDQHHVLQIVQPFADNVKRIFEKYIEVKNVRILREELIKEEIKSATGRYFSCGNLYTILSNKAYLGKIIHNNKIYDGQHEAIISEELFDQARQILAQNAVERKNHVNAKNGTLLASLIYDDVGNRMVPTHSNGVNRHYRYYESQAVQRSGEYERGEILKIAAGEIENYVKTDLENLLKDTTQMQSYLEDLTISEQRNILKEIEGFIPDIVFTRRSIKRVDLKTDLIKITYDVNFIVKYLESKLKNTELEYSAEDGVLLERTQKVRISQTPQKRNKIVILGKANYNITLINALVRSFWYNNMAAERKLPPKEKHGYSKKLRKLRYLPPRIIEDIMNGTQDTEWTVTDLVRMAEEYWKKLK